MYHHSALSGEHGDAVIVCGSSVKQIEDNMDVSVDSKKLPQVYDIYRTHVISLSSPSNISSIILHIYSPKDDPTQSVRTLVLGMSAQTFVRIRLGLL